MPTQQTPYDALSPDAILDALETVGFHPTGGLLALNSYENRVYQAEMDDGSFTVAKFYRPQRWSREAIIEEHAFTLELADEEISVVPPLQRDGTTLFEHLGFQFAVFPRQGGHPPNLEVEDDLEVLARTIARMHMVGARSGFEHRLTIDSASFGHASRDYLLSSTFIPADLVEAYATITAHLLERVDQAMEQTTNEVRNIRIHGDCHMGNVLWRDDTAHFVDFDDCMRGPPVQDLWMLLSGERSEQTYQLSVILDAYNEFFDFEPSTLKLIEPLRTLRIMHHAAWIARRWNDPAFPAAFPWFDSAKYWSEHVLELREQQAALDEPPLTYM
jgi:Ser/Thr protein kinase RdoA (MazF antagonist)